MPAKLFTELYVQQGPRLPDDKRARLRIGMLLRSDMFRYIDGSLATFIERRLGVRLEWGWDHPKFDQFVQTCTIYDLLNSITLIYQFLHENGPADAKRWRDGIKEIFGQQNLAYEIDDRGGVHPAVDQEFQRNRVSAIAALQSASRYDNVRLSFERVSSLLAEDPPNYKEAWRATFGATEGLFRLIFPDAPQLKVEQIRQRLRPLLQTRYAGDRTALQAALRLAISFAEWVEASHNYRHEQGSEEPAQPPADIAILAISQGAALLRWLAEVDATRPR